MMRAQVHVALCCLFLLAAVLPTLAQQGTSGGRDVNVALFSAQPAHTLLLKPLSDETWTARCATCAHRPLRQSLTLTAPIDLFAGGSLRLTDPASGLERAAVGLWHVRALGSQAALAVTLKLPSEHYVTAVLAAEAAPNEPAASLRALAIVARSYALNGSHFQPLPGQLPAELCDSTACQAVHFGPASHEIDTAVRDTAGEILWFKGRHAEVFFSQHCGGITEDAGALWPALQRTPYLVSHPDPFCLRQGPAAWHAEIPLEAIRSVAIAQGWSMSSSPVSATVSQRTSSGRAHIVRFFGANGDALQVPAPALRLAVDRALGWNRVRSDLYQIRIAHGMLVFDGRGHGHGVGLCQTGATQMARQGKSSNDILAFYFPGTKPGISPEDDGWVTTSLGPFTLHITQPLSRTQQAALIASWSEAVRRFPLDRPVSPALTIAPSTELYRQLAGQPGWNLASTSVAGTVFQPIATLERNRISLQTLALHEFLHLRVESIATNRSPLWLREGLVEALSEPDAKSITPSDMSHVELSLHSPITQGEALHAHQIAAACVHRLLQRYGLATVRSWLIGGVPSGVVCS